MKRNASFGFGGALWLPLFLKSLRDCGGCSVEGVEIDGASLTAPYNTSPYTDGTCAVN